MMLGKTNILFIQTLISTQQNIERILFVFRLFIDVNKNRQCRTEYEWEFFSRCFPVTLTKIFSWIETRYLLSTNICLTIYLIQRNAQRLFEAKIFLFVFLKITKKKHFDKSSDSSFPTGGEIFLRRTKTIPNTVL